MYTVKFVMVALFLVTLSEVISSNADSYDIEVMNTKKANSSDTPSYVTAAFRSYKQFEAYIFLKNRFVIDDYHPGEATDKILYGPVSISQGLPALKGTIFCNYGIDCALPSPYMYNTYIFALQYCVLLDCGPSSKCNKIIKGPMSIAEMFPVLQGTVFEKGIDAAFESNSKLALLDAHLFKGDQYARISFGPFGRSVILAAHGTISQFWPSLKGTIFESDIGAAFASHLENEAYLFKEDSYARIKLTTLNTDDHIIGGVHKIKDFWPELGKLLP